MNNIEDDRTSVPQAAHRAGVTESGSLHRADEEPLLQGPHGVPLLGPPVSPRLSVYVPDAVCLVYTVQGDGDFWKLRVTFLCHVYRYLFYDIVIV
jgi:hypothetical protein